jgi:hypothetical protein
MVAWNIVLAAELPSTMASDTCTAVDISATWCA